MENIELKEGYILDYATGKPVDTRKPEEIVRQEYEKTLLEDFNDDGEMIDIDVSIQRGKFWDASPCTVEATVLIPTYGCPVGCVGETSPGSDAPFIGIIPSILLAWLLLIIT